MSLLLQLDQKIPGKLSFKLQQQIQKLFIGSFFVQYRANGAMKDLTDEQIKTDLEDYFIKSIVPRFVNDSKHYLLCARINRKLIGFVFWEDLGRNQAYIAELVISNDYWRQGLGRVLVGSIFNKKPNIKKAMLLTEHKNHGAKNFYKALGYKPSLYVRKGYDVKDFCAYEIEI